MLEEKEESKECFDWWESCVVIETDSETSNNYELNEQNLLPFKTEESELEQVLLLNPPLTLKSVVEYVLSEKKDIFDVREDEDLIVLNDENL